MNLLDLISQYEQKKYDTIQDQAFDILQSKDPAMLLVLIKSIIHLVGGDDPRVKTYLCLYFCLQDEIRFRWGVSLVFIGEKNTDSIFENLSSHEGFMSQWKISGKIDFIEDKQKKYLIKLSYSPTNLDIFMVFIFYTLELYDMEHQEYPMIKWLSHHFYKND